MLGSALRSVLRGAVPIFSTNVKMGERIASRMRATSFDAFVLVEFVYVDSTVEEALSWAEFE